MSYVGNTPADKFLTLEKQQFSVSATTGYTLSHSVSSPQDIALFINNVRQNPNSSYTVSGTALTLSSPGTSSGDTMYCVFLGKAIGTVAPATGSVTNNMLVNSGITLNGSAVSLGGSATIASGITMSDLWRQSAITAINAATDTDLTANWEQPDGDGFGGIGTAMSQSSGIFTFPTTGIYLIIYNAQIHSPSQGATYAGGRINVTTNNSSYSVASEGYASIYHSNGYGLATTYHQFDVTSTSTHKIKFSVVCEFASDVRGSTDQNRTCVQFIRLGDT